MGFWGYGYFDNDGAWDFADALMQTSDMSLLSRTIVAANDPSSIRDEYICAEAIAAIATLTGLDFEYEVNHSKAEEMIKEWLQKNTVTMCLQLWRQSVQALEYIRGEGSGLYQLIVDTPHFEGWLRQLDVLEHFLNKNRSSSSDTAS